MCYSGRCHFEDWMGNCTICNNTKFKEHYGYSACLIGGYPDSPEVVEWIETHGNIIKSITRRYYADKAERLKRFEDAFNI